MATSYANDKSPLGLDESNGIVIVKFFFQGNSVPSGIPDLGYRGKFKTVRGKRQDTGECLIRQSGVSPKLLRLGIANAEGHQWKLVDIGQWEQEITDKHMAKLIGRDTQNVVQLVYKAAPNPEEILELSRPVRDAIVVLSNRFSWNDSTWWNQDGPITVNFTSPSEDPPKYLAVVREGTFVLIEAEPKAA